MEENASCTRRCLNWNWILWTLIYFDVKTGKLKTHVIMNLRHSSKTVFHQESRHNTDFTLHQHQPSPGRGSVVRWQSFIPRQVQPRVETRDTWHVLLPTRTWSASSVTADQTKGLRLWNIFTVLFFFINLYWVLVDLRYIYVDFWSVGFMRGSDQIHFFNTWIYSRLDWSPSMSPN